MSEKIAIKNCVLLGDKGERIFGKTVVLAEGRIERITETAPKKNGNDQLEDSRVIDAGGAYLLPGLINLHVHINRRNVSRENGTFRLGAPAIELLPDGQRMLYAARNAWFEMLYQGVTTMRDLCSVGRTANELKAAIHAGIIGGPRLFTCGMGIAAPGGHETHRYKGAVEVDDPEAIIEAVREEIRRGADFIKVMASGGIGGMPEHEHPNRIEMTRDKIAAAVSAAHEADKEVTVHAMGIAPVMESLLGGVDGIEHGTMLDEEALKIMEERQVYYVPTASGITAVAEKEAERGNAALAETIRKLVVEPQRESIRMAKARGLLIGAGSDTLGSVLNELLIFEACGFTRKECLDTATINAAKILHMEDRLGAVREGYVADLILVDGDPMEDLHNLARVKTVFKGGQEVTLERLVNLK